MFELIITEDNNSEDILLRQHPFEGSGISPALQSPQYNAIAHPRLHGRANGQL